MNIQSKALAGTAVLFFRIFSTSAAHANHLGDPSGTVKGGGSMMPTRQMSLGMMQGGHGGL